MTAPATRIGTSITPPTLIVVLSTAITGVRITIAPVPYSTPGSVILLATYTTRLLAPGFLRVIWIMYSIVSQMPKA